jgi:arginyl-tRNA synthetase
MKIEELLTTAVATAIKDLYQAEADETQVTFQQTRKDFDGDITLVVFPFLRISKKSPEQTADEIGEYLCSHVEEVSACNTVKGFLNIVIANNYWLHFLNDTLNTSNYGHSQTASGKTIIVEYSSPNTNKPLHLGHIRNNLLGYSVSEILKANGHKVVKTQIINDRGIHICKSMLAWQKWGNGETPETTGEKGDKLVGRYYVMFDKELKRQAQEKLREWVIGKNLPDDKKLLNDIKENSGVVQKQDGTGGDVSTVSFNEAFLEEAKKHTDIMKEAQQMLRKWEAKDTDVYDLWEEMNGWVYKGFEQTYKELGVDFDKLYYESNTWMYGKQKVEEGLAKGIFIKEEDGSIWCDLTDDGLDKKILLRADGTTVYMTQDIGTAIMRYEDYPETSQMIYTVGNEQDYHFKVLFLILDKLGYSWAKSCYHLSYGMVDLPSGKMKSREGTVVDADDLMQEMFDTSRKTSEDLGKVDDLPEDEKTQLFKTIGLGALKYFMLKVDPKKRMLFNPEESVDFTGNTGPFIQYTYARIRSVLRKANDVTAQANTEVDLMPVEKQLLKLVYRYPEIIDEAGSSYSPALIANYVYELVKEYNHFYQTIPILKEDDTNALQVRLLISKQVADVIKDAMALLGINVPERM